MACLNRCARLIHGHATGRVREPGNVRWLLQADVICLRHHVVAAALGAARRPATCAGRPRNWKNNMLGHPFGQDVGRDNQPGALAQAACSTQKEARTNPPSAAYSSAAPMATWRAGSTVTLRWPAKNHATVNSGPGTVQVYMGTAGGNDAPARRR
mgnify:CR=1 FL=1